MKNFLHKGLFSFGFTLLICGAFLTPSGYLWADPGQATECKGCNACTASQSGQYCTGDNTCTQNQCVCKEKANGLGVYWCDLNS